MDCCLPGSSVHGIIQTKILTWVAISLLQGIFLAQRSNMHLLHCRRFLTVWATWGAGVQKCLPITLCHVQLFSSMIFHLVYFSNVKLACQDTLWQAELMGWRYGDQLTLIRAHLFSLLGTEVRLHADHSDGSSRIQLCQSSHCQVDANSNCNFPEVGICLLIMCWKVRTFLGVDVCECACERETEKEHAFLLQWNRIYE